MAGIDIGIFIHSNAAPFWFRFHPVSIFQLFSDKSCSIVELNKALNTFEPNIFNLCTRFTTIVNV